MSSGMSFDGESFLRDDDSLVRQTFFGILRHHHPNMANKVDVVYALSQAWCASQSEDDFELLEKYLSKLLPEEMILVSCTGVNNAQLALCAGNAYPHRRSGGLVPRSHPPPYLSRDYTCSSKISSLARSWTSRCYEVLEWVQQSASLQFVGDT